MTLSNDFPLIINIAMVVITVYGLIRGYINGFLTQGVNLILNIISLAIAFMLAPGMANLIHIFPKNMTPLIDSPLGEAFYSKLNTISWFLLILLICSLIRWLISPLFRALRNVEFVRKFDSIGGALLSLIPTALLFIVATYILSTPLFVNGRDAVERSALKYTTKATDLVTNLVSDTFKENASLQKLLHDPLSLGEDDLKGIVGWLKNADISSEAIYDFLMNYGIDAHQIDAVLHPED